MTDPDKPKTGLFVRSTRVNQDEVIKTTVTLYPGDAVEYKVSHQVELPDRTQMWVGFGATTHTQLGESGADTADRLVGFVHDQVKHRIVQAVQDAQNIDL